MNIIAHGTDDGGTGHRPNRTLPDRALVPTCRDRAAMTAIVTDITVVCEEIAHVTTPATLLHCAGCHREMTFYGYRPPLTPLCQFCETRSN